MAVFHFTCLLLASTRYNSICLVLVTALAAVYDAVDGSSLALCLGLPLEKRGRSFLCSQVLLKTHLGFLLEALTPAPWTGTWDVWDMEAPFSGIHINYSLSCSLFPSIFFPPTCEIFCWSWGRSGGGAVAAVGGGR